MSISRSNNLAGSIDACLPQTQCTQCGYLRCRPYAEAIARGEADINRCPPGGEVTIRGLAELLRVPPIPLNRACGTHEPRHSAIIDENECIGCTLCIAACPVDAILGVSKKMHTVIADECTGCKLCVAPCPVDCIKMIPYRYDGSRDDWLWSDYSLDQADRARRRVEARCDRQARRHQTRAIRSETAGTVPRTNNDQLFPTKAQMKEEIKAAVERERKKLTRNCARYCT